MREVHNSSVVGMATCGAADAVPVRRARLESSVLRGDPVGNPLQRCRVDLRAEPPISLKVHIGVSGPADNKMWKDVASRLWLVMGAMSSHRP